MNHNHAQIKHIFFDLDHTLWDFDKNSELAFVQIFKQQNININIKTFIDIYIPINHACWKLYENNQMSAEEHCLWWRASTAGPCHFLALQVNFKVEVDMEVEE